MAYASISDVRTMVSFKTIDGTSEPRLQEVVTMIDQVSAEIDIKLAGQGYAVPISASAVTAFAYLTQLNAYGAAMRAEAASSKGKESKHVEFLERMYNTSLKDLMNGEITLPGVSKDIAAGARTPRAGGSASAPFTNDSVF